MFTGVIPDGQETTRRIKEKIVLHVCHPVCLCEQTIDGCDPGTSTLTSIGDKSAQRFKPSFLVSRRSQGKPLFDARQHCLLKICQLAQRWYPVELGQQVKTIVNSIVLKPRCKQQQFIESIPALPDKGLHPRQQEVFGGGTFDRYLAYQFRAHLDPTLQQYPRSLK